VSAVSSSLGPSSVAAPCAHQSAHGSAPPPGQAPPPLAAPGAAVRVRPRPTAAAAVRPVPPCSAFRGLPSSPRRQRARAQEPPAAPLQGV